MKAYLEEDKIILIFIGICFVLFIVGIGLEEHFFGFRSEKKMINCKVEREIYSLKSKSAVKGSFILGTGRIREEDYYFFFSKDEKFGGFVKEKTPARETLLIEKDTIPSIIKNYLVKKVVYKRFFNTDRVSYDTLEYGLFRKPSLVGYKYVLIIPKGTITENQSFEPL
ncbi:hypothetical protein CAPN002_00230 [Capnocytophaga stomatis]|uniref:hypothetical protein n=1 Tax=Capnocytophaga stomatis TaxID=1848904 RepID=UPI00194E98F9|nr:hypothetical protein [Capnocytophaga stomatis]GIJ92805.1 hypothetical protein CAPN002_00230 [Capnocytophaga stomatis]